MSDENKISRREFIKGSAAVGAGLATAAIMPAAVGVAAPPEKWDYEADVVVAGAGGSGSTAAIVAHDAGSKAIILERLPSPGGNTSISNGGSTVGPVDALWKQTYGPASEGLAGVDVDLDYLKMLAGETIPSVRFLESLGIQWAVKIVGDKVESASPANAGAGPAFYKVLGEGLKARGINTLYETPARELVQNPNTREVIGLKAVNAAGKEVFVKARKGVVIATGGWTRNKDMLKTYYPEVADATSCQRPGASYGDGILMLQAVGARVRTMTHMCIGLGIEYSVEQDMAYECHFFFPWSILVDEKAKRFFNEPTRMLDLALLVPKKKAVWCVFDDETRKVEINKTTGRRLTGPFLSDDWSAELNKGIIRKADTIQELAGKIGLDAAALKTTVETWNKYATDKKDPDFGRDTGFIQIAKSPFYAFKTRCTLVETSGGAQVEAKTGKVIDVFGRVIPRLYSVGVTVGAFMPMPYIGGAYLITSVTTGRIAGKSVAAEKPWDAV